MRSQSALIYYATPTTKSTQLTDCVVSHIVLIAGRALAMFSVVLDYISLH